VLAAIDRPSTGARSDARAARLSNWRGSMTRTLAAPMSCPFGNSGASRMPVVERQPAWLTRRQQMPTGMPIFRLLQRSRCAPWIRLTREYVTTATAS